MATLKKILTHDNHGRRQVCQPATVLLRVNKQKMTKQLGKCHTVLLQLSNIIFNTTFVYGTVAGKVNEQLENQKEALEIWLHRRIDRISRKQMQASREVGNARRAGGKNLFKQRQIRCHSYTYCPYPCL